MSFNQFFKNRGGWHGFVLAIFLVFFATGMRHLCDLFIRDLNAPFLFFYPVILLSAWYGGFLPGLVSIFLSAFAGNYFFIKPYYTLNLDQTLEEFHTLLFILIGFFVILLTRHFRKTVKKQKKIEQELHLSQSKVRSILENVSGCFFTLDRDWRFVYLSLHCKEYLPALPETILGKTLWEVYPHWIETECYHQLSHLRSSDNSDNIVHFEFFDGEKVKWYEMYASSSLEGYFIHFYDITSRKQSEEALVASEGKLRRIEESLTNFFENAVIPIHCIDPNGIILQANKAELKLLGYAPEDYIGHSIEEFHVDRETIQDILSRLRGKEILQNYEAKLRCKNGSIKHVLIDSNAYWENGKLIHSRCFTRDVTSQKWADLQRETEYLITQTLAVAPSLEAAIPRILQTISENFNWEIGVFWTITPSLNEMRCIGTWQHPSIQDSEFVKRSYEFSFQIGEGLPGQVWKNAHPRWIEDISEETNFPRKSYAMKEDLRSAFAFPVLLNEEVLGVMEFFSYSIREPDQSLLQMFDGIGSEIGQFMERKEAEDALRETEQQFQLALQAAQMGYWLWDIQKNKIKWSDYIASIHGIDENKFEGNFEEYLLLIHPEDRELVRSKVLESVEQKVDYLIEFRVLWPDQTVHWVHARGQVFYNRDQPSRMVGFAIDITNKKEIEEKLRIAYEKMEQRVQERTAELIKTNQTLQKEILERKKVEEEVLQISLKEQRRFGSQLHDGVCQDLAGILMLIKGLTKKMEKRDEVGAAELKKIANILHEAVNQARDMARGLYPVELEGTSLMKSLRELVDRTQILLKVDCRFLCPQPIRVDDHNLATHLYRIAQEGINNAIKHGVAKQIEVSLIKKGTDLILTVKDDGNGLLSPVEDSKDSKGIGLQILKYRARMIDATIRFEPNFPQGTQLICSLKVPLSEQEIFTEKNEKVYSYLN